MAERVTSLFGGHSILAVTKPVEGFTDFDGGRQHRLPNPRCDRAVWTSGEFPVQPIRPRFAVRRSAADEHSTGARPPSYRPRTGGRLRKPSAKSLL